MVDEESTIGNGLTRQDLPTHYINPGKQTNNQPTTPLSPLKSLRPKFKPETPSYPKAYVGSALYPVLQYVSLVETYATPSEQATRVLLIIGL